MLVLVVFDQTKCYQQISSYACSLTLSSANPYIAFASKSSWVSSNIFPRISSAILHKYLYIQSSSSGNLYYRSPKNSPVPNIQPGYNDHLFSTTSSHPFRSLTAPNTVDNCQQPIHFRTTYKT